jgi:hypothetical protein
VEGVTAQSSSSSQCGLRQNPVNRCREIAKIAFRTEIPTVASGGIHAALNVPRALPVKLIHFWSIESFENVEEVWHSAYPVATRQRHYNTFSEFAYGVGLEDLSYPDKFRTGWANRCWHIPETIRAVASTSHAAMSRSAARLCGYQLTGTGIRFSAEAGVTVAGDEASRWPLPGAAENS